MKREKAILDKYYREEINKSNFRSNKLEEENARLQELLKEQKDFHDINIGKLFQESPMATHKDKRSKNLVSGTKRVTMSSDIQQRTFNDEGYTDDTIIIDSGVVQQLDEVMDTDDQSLSEEIKPFDSSANLVNDLLSLNDTPMDEETLDDERKPAALPVIQNVGGKTSLSHSMKKLHMPKHPDTKKVSGKRV
jgi:hypothetical protein